MPFIVHTLQLTVAVILLVTWTFNLNRATIFRGGDARSMMEEFEVYDLPQWSVFVVGALKIIGATMLIVGLVVEEVVAPAAVVISVLMVGAVVMHLKVRDAWLKTFPSLFVLSASIVVLTDALL